MASELSFPPYLVSHALSTGHYSFLKRAEAATSSLELNTVCAQETDRIRTILAKGKLSEVSHDPKHALIPLNDTEIRRLIPLQASTREALVLLMAITDRASATDHSHRTLGLVPALNIATGSRDGRAKAMGTSADTPYDDRVLSGTGLELTACVTPLSSGSGYLYLNENLTASDEIHLLLFNTILKASLPQPS